MLTSNNNIFSTLCELQSLVKRESSQKTIITRVKHNHIQSVQHISSQILHAKLKICSIIDSINQNSSLKYILKQNADETFRLTEESLYIEPLIFYLKNHQELAYRLLTLTDSDESKRLFSSFFVNYFYTNSFSSSPIDNEFLLMLYRTLRNEIQALSTSEPLKFLKSSINYYLFKHFIHREDVTNYFTNILASVIEKIDKLDEFKELTFDPKKMAYQIQVAQNAKSNRIYFRDDKTNETITTTDTESSSHTEDSNDSNNKIKKDEFFAKYMTDLNVKEVEKSTTNVKTQNIKDYINKCLGIKTNDNQIDQKYNNSGFVDGVYSSTKPSALIEVIFHNFSIVIDLIEYIYVKLSDIDSIPMSIRYICKLIAMIVEEKFPNVHKIERNAFISQFFVNCLLIPIMNKPELCGLVKSGIILGTTKANLNLLSKILITFSAGIFFNNADNPNYTIFNRYFIEKIETPLHFFDALVDVELPEWLTTLINDHQNLNTYVYDYFKENPTEHIRDVSFCFSNDLVLKMIELFDKNKEQFTKYNGAKFEEFTGAVRYLCSHKEKITKDRDKAIKAFPNEKFVFAIQDIQYSNKLKEIMSEDWGHSLFQDNSKTTTFVNPKRSLYTILLNLQDLNENQFFKEEITCYTGFINSLRKISQLSYFSLDSAVNNDWFINSFDNFMKQLPAEYRANNYHKFFMEMKTDLENSIQTQAFEDLKYLINKRRYADNNLRHHQQTAEKLKKYGYTQIIRKFMAEKNIECSLIIDKIENKDSSITNTVLIKPKDELLNLKLKYLDEFLYDNKLDAKTEITKITDLVRQFPSFKHISSEKKLIFQHEYKVPEALNAYFDIFLYFFYKNNNESSKKQPTKNRKQSKRATLIEIIKQVIHEIKHEEQYQQIRSVIHTYLMNKLYNHLFPVESEKHDQIIHYNCQRLSWIQFSDVVTYDDITIDNLKSVAFDYIRKVDDFKCPNAKLKLLHEIKGCIIKSLSLCGKENEQQKLLWKYMVFLIVCVAPKKIYSNYQYVLLYADFEGNNVNKKEFEQEYQKVLEYLCNPNESILIHKMRREEFEQMCMDKESEVNLSKSEEGISSISNSLSKRSE